VYLADRRRKRRRSR